MPAPKALYPVPALLKWRLWRRFPQEELAKRAEISRAALSALERGGKARIGTIDKLAAVLNITPEQLLETEPGQQK